jgi:hypothetical protein
MLQRDRENRAPIRDKDHAAAMALSIVRRIPSPDKIP